MSELSRRCSLVSACGAVASAALLIADLGRPARFLNMLRVLRPSSPMNMGTWFLSAFGGCAGLTALFRSSTSVGPGFAIAHPVSIAAGASRQPRRFGRPCAPHP
jgi:hypothetical protein